jgi:PDZ domain-containing protein
MSPSAPSTTSASPESGPAASGRSRLGTWWRALARTPFLTAAVVIGLIALVVGVLFVIPTPYQVLLPGPVQDVQQLIQPYPKPIKGRLYLTTIYSEPASVGEWLWAKANPEAGIIPRDQATPRGVGEQQYQRLLGQMMDESKIAAKVVALRAAGYEVKITGQGAEVEDVAAYSKARGVLRRGDVIVGIDGQPVSTANDLVAALQAHRPGDVVTLQIRRGNDELAVDVPLVEAPDEPGRARAGIVVLTHLFQYELPAQIEIKTQDIGGPSAGLMFALGIYNAVSPIDITKGHKIAGTGTISTDGKVGPVGGVRYKVEAAEKAGAELFLAPRDNDDEARQAARKLRVVAVGSFDEALATLMSLPEAGS